MVVVLRCAVLKDITVVPLTPGRLARGRAAVGHGGWDADWRYRRSADLRRYGVRIHRDLWALADIPKYAREALFRRIGMMTAKTIRKVPKNPVLQRFCNGSVVYWAYN